MPRHHPRGDPEVVRHVLRDGLEELAAHGVDLPFCGRHAPGAAHEHPEQTLARCRSATPGLRSGVVPPLARDPTDGGIGERHDDVCERVLRELGVGIREDENLAARRLRRERDRSVLPNPREREEPHASAELGHEVVRAVVGPVGGDDDLDALGGIVQCEGVLELLDDDRGFVVRGDDDRDRGPCPTLGQGPERSSPRTTTRAGNPP